MKPKNRKILTDFIDRAEKIQNYSYLAGGEKIIGMEIKEIDGKEQVVFYQPDKEKTEAILFNLKPFVQNKDDISIGRLTVLCDDPGISESWKSEYKNIRAEMNTRLDMMSISGNNETLTYRDIFDMFLFGNESHRAEKDKSYKMYHKWVTEENYELFYSTFHEAVIWVLVAVINIAKASKEELLRTPMI